MRLAVLASPESWYVKDLRRAAEDRVEIATLPFSRIRSALYRDSTDHASREASLSGFDAVLIRTMPPGSLEQVVFRMDVLQRLGAEGTVIVNRPRTIEAAVDKYLALAKIKEAGLTTPKTWACQTVEDAMEGFEALGGDVVVKPLFGGEGRGVARIDDEAMALRSFALLQQLSAVIYLQEFIPHQGYDIRLFVCGDSVLGMQRHSEDDWRTNISRGATAKPIEITEELAKLAKQAAAAVDGDIIGVDLLPAESGELFAIEVNAVPGWKALARACEVDVARLVLDRVQQLVDMRK